MNFSAICEYIQKSQAVPSTTSSAYQEWLEFTDALEFLIVSFNDHVPLYISAKYFFVYSVLVPKHKLRGNYVNNILPWNMGVSAGWGYGYNPRTKRSEKFIASPLDDTGSSILY